MFMKNRVTVMTMMLSKGRDQVFLCVSTIHKLLYRSYGQDVTRRVLCLTADLLTMEAKRTCTPELVVNGIVLPWNKARKESKVLCTFTEGVDDPHIELLFPNLTPAMVKWLKIHLDEDMDLTLPIEIDEVLKCADVLDVTNMVLTICRNALIWIKDTDPPLTHEAYLGMLDNAPIPVAPLGANFLKGLVWLFWNSKMARVPTVFKIMKGYFSPDAIYIKNNELRYCHNDNGDSDVIGSWSSRTVVGPTLTQATIITNKDAATVRVDFAEYSTRRYAWSAYLAFLPRLSTFSPSGRYFLVQRLDNDERVQVWDTQTRQVIHASTLLSLEGHWEFIGDRFICQSAYGASTAVHIIGLDNDITHTFHDAMSNCQPWICITANFVAMQSVPEGISVAERYAMGFEVVPERIQVFRLDTGERVHDLFHVFGTRVSLAEANDAKDEVYVRTPYLRFRLNLAEGTIMEDGIVNESHRLGMKVLVN